MGATVEIGCPLCGYSTYFRLGMGEETGEGYAAKVSILQAEHPDHPDKTAS